MDALNFAWPNEGTKLTLKYETLSIYSLKLDITEDKDAQDAPCISGSNYSYSQVIGDFNDIIYDIYSNLIFLFTVFDN